MQVTSYGGSLRYTVQYLPGFDAEPTDFPDVEISVSLPEIAAACTMFEHILRVVIKLIWLLLILLPHGYRIL